MNAVGKHLKEIKPRISTDYTRISKPWPKQINLEYEDITEDIIGSAYEVHNILGRGF